ncbi:hypothetical protein [Enterobacter phage 04_vB_Eclo_IJM]|nr:hypothetical protein [Enterobacter phage 04_vB_Eclo_IJM]
MDQRGRSATDEEAGLYRQEVIDLIEKCLVEWSRDL